ncbi:MAG TPA: glycoside hydrolase family 99-like domain-containing protein, partial [Candidatus Paceibacterota bacterium]|nr:glycoside hydrolase family 99-like domain-containing protein [Candidatus Paceibacterota bacterium]
MRNLSATVVVAAAMLAGGGRAPDLKEPRVRDSGITVACYYFGQYHPNDPRNLKERGGPWSEWELIKAAKPRFPGHAQPKVPQWGYEDESDPRVMAKKIDAAADHGIDAFIFDWYHYED